MKRTSLRVYMSLPVSCRLLMISGFAAERRRHRRSGRRPGTAPGWGRKDLLPCTTSDYGARHSQFQASTLSQQPGKRLQHNTASTALSWRARNTDLQVDQLPQRIQPPVHCRTPLRAPPCPATATLGPVRVWVKQLQQQDGPPVPRALRQGLPRLPFLPLLGVAIGRPSMHISVALLQLQQQP